MFTGIIREIGKVKGIRHRGAFMVLDVACSKTLEVSVPGDSVAVNGVCLTLTRKSSVLSFDVVSNTAENTNLKRLKCGSEVNLENALKMGDDVSGHIVSGHIDGERKIKKNVCNSSGWVLEVMKSREDEGLVVQKGSVAIDGVSLTVAMDEAKFFRIFLIPYTLNDTTLSNKNSGDYVNVEYDILGKYATRNAARSFLTADRLKENGFI